MTEHNLTEVTPVPGGQPEPSEALDRLYADFARNSTAPLWTQTNDLMPLEPKPAAVPFVWKWAELLDIAKRAGDLVPALAAAAGGRLRVLAASIKSPEQAVQAIVSGADAVTAPWAVLEALMRDELTDSAVEAFPAAVPS